MTVDGEEKLIFAVPGVPWEMQEMVAGTVIPQLRERMGGDRRHPQSGHPDVGHSESGIAELLQDRSPSSTTSATRPSALLASGVEGLKVRVTAKAPTEEEADAVLAAEVELIAPILTDFVFSTRTGRWKPRCSTF